MSFEEFSNYDGIGLADLVRKKEVTPLELVDAAIDRVERHDNKLNAVVYKAFDEARDLAKGPLPDGPFAGVPLMIKDLPCEVKGWPHTRGSRYFRDSVDTEDSILTTRYREAGFVLMGKTNTPEFGITGTTEGAQLGACRNPWNPDHIAGGSSGGAAAAVASGMIPIGHASDGLGSIRIPASICGLFGLKTTRDRNPYGGDLDRVIGLSVDHVVTRTVRDSAVALDATGYPEPQSPYAYPAKERPFAMEVGTNPGKLKIAYSIENGIGGDLAPDVLRGLNETVELLKSLGHDVQERSLGINWRKMYKAHSAFSASDFAAKIRELTEAEGREPQEDDFEPLTWAIIKAGQRTSGEDVMRGMRTLRAINRQILALFEEFDVYLAPVLGIEPPKVGFMDPVNMDPRTFNKQQAQILATTPPFNFTGQPAMSVPLCMSDNNLPIGMHFVGRYGDEATLIRLASQLETEAPWIDRRPPIWG